MIKYYDVVLIDAGGFELTRRDDILTLRAAKDTAKYLLSDTYAESVESTHARMETEKVEIRDKAGDCIWDNFHRRRHSVVETEILNAIAPGTPLEEFGTTGLIDYVLGALAPAFTSAFSVIRRDNACDIIKHRAGPAAVTIFRAALQRSADQRKPSLTAAMAS